MFPPAWCVPERSVHTTPGAALEKFFLRRKEVKVAADKHVIMSPSRLEMESQKTPLVNTEL